MKIRAITSFFDPLMDTTSALKSLANCTSEIIAALEVKGIVVQSRRIATPPFPQWADSRGRENRHETIRSLVGQTRNLGWQYTSIGPALPETINDYRDIPHLLMLDETVFAGGIISTREQLYPNATNAAAKVITENAKTSPDGFTNLRFAALANVEPYAPFLPAAYAQTGQGPAIAMAIECADSAVNAFSEIKTITDGMGAFLRQLEDYARSIEDACIGLCAHYAVEFKGFDFSPAPYPQEWCSLGRALELLGVPALGGSGSLAAAALVASTLDKGKWKKTGFNGLMLAVMEDSTLALRAAEKRLTLKDLLLYSAVCGTGLDTIPLPGDATPEQINSVLLDLGALAIRLNKPLTGRLMPIPGKQTGDKTNFEFEFFANSRIMELGTQTIGAPLYDAPMINIPSRK
jgi:hypothetical protein